MRRGGSLILASHSIFRFLAVIRASLCNVPLSAEHGFRESRRGVTWYESSIRGKDARVRRSREHSFAGNNCTQEQGSSAGRFPGRGDKWDERIQHRDHRVHGEEQTSEFIPAESGGVRRRQRKGIR